MDALLVDGEECDAFRCRVDTRRQFAGWQRRFQCGVSS